MRYFFIVLAVASLVLDARAQSWKSLPASPVGRLDASDSNHLLVFRGDGEYWLSDDAGASWKHRLFPGDKPTSYSYTAKRVNDSVLMVFGTRHLFSQVYVPWVKSSSDTGRTFTHQDMQSSGFSWATLVDRTSSSWYYGQLVPLDYRTIGKIYGGSNQLRFEAGSGQFEPFVLSIDSRDSVAMSLNGIYKSYHVWATTDLGRTWTKLDTFDREPGLIRSQSDSRWFMSRDSSLYQTSDLGKSWMISAQFGSRINDFQFDETLGFLALYGADHIYASTDSGATWFAQSIDNQMNVSRIVLTGAGTGYAQVSGGVIKLDAHSIRRSAVLSMPRSIDLGLLSPDSVITMRVILQNVGASALKLEQPNASSPRISSLALSHSELAPGSSDSAVLTFTYSLGSKQTDTLIINVPSNTQTGNETILLHARLRDPATVGVSQSPSPVAIYPNPVANVLLLDAGLESIVSACVFDVLGRCVIRAVEGNEQLDVTQLVAGNYLIQFRLGSGSIVMKRFVKTDQGK